MTRPRRLSPGTTVGVLSPSSGGPATFPHIYEAGVEVLRSVFGLNVVELPHTRADNKVLYGHPQLRADDMNNAFSDPHIEGIFTSIGGDDSVRILPYVDTNTVLSNPKPIMGLSDSTTFLAYFASLGMTTLYGPSVMVGISQIHQLSPEFRTHLQSILFEDSTGYQYRPYPQWSEGYPDWKDPENTGKVLNQQENTEGWHWLQGDGVVQGPLWGGCVEVLEFLKGTRFWPESPFWDNMVLLLETSEEEPTVNQVKYMLRNYGMQGILQKASALLVGRPRGYSVEQKDRLDATVVRVVKEEFGRSDMPVVSNVDFGHTDPQLVFPLGGQIEIDCAKRTLKLPESALA
jgi:muramoyltetrapeptide carboxypeptidase LdcA involved in peptidoglycan recycling